MSGAFSKTVAVEMNMLCKTCPLCGLDYNAKKISDSSWCPPVLAPLYIRIRQSSQDSCAEAFVSHAMARTPGPANKDYGFANWFLNTDRKPLPSAPETSVTFRGNGQNIVYIDWDHDIVAVIRWIGTTKQLDEVIGKIEAAVK